MARGGRPHNTPVEKLTKKRPHTLTKKGKTTDPTTTTPTSSPMLVDTALSPSLAGAVTQVVKDAFNSSNNTSYVRTSSEEVGGVIEGHPKDLTEKEGKKPTAEKPPSRFESIAVRLGNRGSAKSKAKIWLDEYIDFGALLAKNLELLTYL